MHKKTTILLLSIVLLAGCCGLWNKNTTEDPIIEQIDLRSLNNRLKATVLMTSGDFRVGTGVLIHYSKKHGLLGLTNHHVIDKGKPDGSVIFGNTTSVVEIKQVLYSDKSDDIAIFRLTLPADKKINIVEIARCYNPLFDDNIEIVKIFPRFKPYVIIAEAWKFWTLDLFKTSDDIIPGNSGSPIFQDGRLIGLVYAHGRTSDGENIHRKAYAVSTDEVHEIINRVLD